jgi:hypothetical protein
MIVGLSIVSERNTNIRSEMDTDGRRSVERRMFSREGWVNV